MIGLSDSGSPQHSSSGGQRPRSCIVRLFFEVIPCAQHSRLSAPEAARVHAPQWVDIGTGPFPLSPLLSLLGGLQADLSGLGANHLDLARGPSAGVGSPRDEADQAGIHLWLIKADGLSIK